MKKTSRVGGELDCLVVCPTYNHEDYIEQALESILNQKTKYKFKILVVDDCSTDSTKDKVLRLTKKNPDLIDLVSYTQNRMHKGKHLDFALITPYAPNYVAFCEGDDFWISDNKLERQINALEQNDKFAFSYHPYELVGSHKTKRHEVVKLHRRLSSSLFVASLYRFFSSSAQVCTVCIRYEAIPFKLLNKAQLNPRDQILVLGAMDKGSRLFQKELTSAYRQHSSNYWSKKEISLRTHQELVVFFLAMRNVTGRARFLALVQVMVRLVRTPGLTIPFLIRKIWPKCP